MLYANAGVSDSNACWTERLVNAIPDPSELKLSTAIFHTCVVALYFNTPPSNNSVEFKLISDKFEILWVDIDVTVADDPFIFPDKSPINLVAFTLLKLASFALISFALISFKTKSVDDVIVFCLVVISGIEGGV